MIGRKRTILLAAICIGAYLGGGGAQSSLALFTDREAESATFATAPSFRTWYLHNYPTPPTGDTAMQATLPMSRRAPTASVLYNYDTDNDSMPGRLLRRGGAGGGISDPRNIQLWLTSPFTVATSVSGSVRLTLWAAMKDFVDGKRGSIIANLREINGATGTTTARGSVTIARDNWQTGSTTWVEVELVFPAATYTIAAGNRLELRLQVAPVPPPDDDMWVAYDTVAYPSRLVLP
jgi:hypothetical protein